MKKSDIKIKVTVGDILNAPLIGVCWLEKYDIDSQSLDEGIMDRDDLIEITLEDAEIIGLIEE